MVVFLVCRSEFCLPRPLLAEPAHSESCSRFTALSCQLSRVPMAARPRPSHPGHFGSSPHDAAAASRSISFADCLAAPRDTQMNQRSQASLLRPARVCRRLEPASTRDRQRHHAAHGLRALDRKILDLFRSCPAWNIATTPDGDAVGFAAANVAVRRVP